MALRLRRDVQKASYYVWFLGAEEAKGLRGSRVINSVLPYLIDRSRGQEPLKVTLQVSHKGIKILQGSSKHFIPHSAITSSTQTDDIVACVLLLYNPATKCPLHVHAYRCDSESTAEALHQQLQILINRPENQKRFEELETRLGILPPMPTSSNKSSTSTAHIKAEHSQQHFQSQKQPQQQQQQQRRLETSPKRFSSSLGSDTGNSTRESECSEEHSGSPVSRSPPMIKPLQQQQSNELFDSLAAELRAKLNGNGPPILLPPRDYDTVHRSKGNLTAIELRRCRNSLIVGSTTPAGTTQSAIANGGGIGGIGSGGGGVVSGSGGGGVAVKQVSSRGSSGIGSDLAPSPERQELNSSSDDEHWSNEADNSVIALKPSQIPIERSNPIIPHHPQLNRKIAVQPPEDSYLRDLPAKPYMPHTTSNGRHNSSTNQHSREKIVKNDGGGHNEGRFEREQRSKTPSATSWNREDEIKPIIMRPADYDAKFNRILQTEQKQQTQLEYRSVSRDHAKLQDTDKYNEINRLLNKKLSLERESPEQQRYPQKVIEDDYDDSDAANEHLPLHGTSSSSAYRKENLTDKQKFIEYSTKKQAPKSYAAEETQRYAGRHRYVDPADLPFEQPTHKKYAAIHRGAPSPDRSLEREHHTAERQRERQRIVDDAPRRDSRERKNEREHFSRSSERNPYREPESIPYIQSMEKMMKSSAMRYKSFESATEPATEEIHSKVSQRSKSYPKHSDGREYNYPRGNRSDYAPSASSSITPKDRFKDAKDKFHAMERTGSRHDLAEEKDSFDYKLKRRSSIEPKDSARVYEEWSDEERYNNSPLPPPLARTRSRSRDHWEQTQQAALSLRERDVLPPREHQIRERDVRDSREQREYTRDLRPREVSGMRSENREVRELRDSREMRDRETRDTYRDHRYDPRDIPPPRTQEREKNRDLPPPREHQRSERTRDHSHEYSREHMTRREYTPEPRSGSEHRVDYTDRSMEKQRVPNPSDIFPAPPPTGGALIPNAKIISNLPKGYRHSYAEPVFARTGGRVGLAAVNPF